MTDLSGKIGLVVGVANKLNRMGHRAGGGCRRGAAGDYAQGERLEENVRVGGWTERAAAVPLDVTSDQQIDDTFAAIDKTFGGLDFVVHGAAFAPREAIAAPFLQTSREAFRVSLDISVLSAAALFCAAPLMEPRGGGILSSFPLPGKPARVHQRNVMGVAKAALEATVRYLASELGAANIRVNAISAGPIKTLAASGNLGLFSDPPAVRDRAPLKRTIDTSEVADAALFLLSNAGRAVTADA